MRKILTFLFAALMSASVFALTPKSGDTWDAVTKTLTVNSNTANNAYYFETEIEHVIISSGVTSLGTSSFFYCAGLLSVTIPEGVEIIPMNCFSFCSNLTSVTIPNSVTSIGNTAFRNCSGLASVTVNATTPPTLGGSAFDGTAAALKIYVPAESVDDYKTAWSAYEDKIVAIPGDEPAEDVNIIPNEDPDHAGVYYSTFFDSSVKYELPAGVEAYVADLSGANLLLTKIAEAGEVIPANVAVILKSTVTPFTLTVSDADAVTFTATNDLQGSDTQIATPANCYVLAGTDGVVGFYHYTAANLNAHKAYVVYSGSNQAPRRMPFIFDQATGVENIQGDNVQSTKMMENGVLYIIKNGVKYNAQGQIVK